jgi:hypothetical protein
VLLPCPMEGRLVAGRLEGALLVMPMPIGYSETFASLYGEDDIRSLVAGLSGLLPAAPYPPGEPKLLSAMFGIWEE